MQTIKITPTFRATLDAIVASGKTPWVIINEDYAVDAFEGRAKARTAKAAGLAGKILLASDVKFRVVDLTPPPAPVVNTTPQAPVHKDLAAFIADAPAAPAAPVAATKTPKIPLTRESTIERPCKRVWHIADDMMAKAGGLQNLRRKDVLAYCVANGIAYYTARTQYQLWLTIQNGGSI